MKQGIFKITNDNYHQHFCDVPTLSTGVIKDLLDSPARCWFNHPKLNPDYVKPEHERKFDLGSAVHAYVLEGGLKLEIITGADDWRKKDNRELAEAAYRAGLIPLLAKQYDQIKAIGKSVIRAIKDCSELQITDLQADGDAELSYCWEESGTWFKTRPDWISKDKKLILDIKTVGQSAYPDDFLRRIVGLGYCIQSSLYRRGCYALHEVMPEFVFAVVEIDPPHLCSIVSLSPEFQELGNQQVETAIKLWRHCLKTGNWPGYRTDRVCWLEPRPWAIAAWSEKKYDLERMIEG